MAFDPVSLWKEKVIGPVNYSSTMAVTLAREAPERIQPQPQQTYQLLLLPPQTVCNVMSIQAENTTQGPSGTTGLTSAVYLRFPLPVSQSKTALLWKSVLHSHLPGPSTKVTFRKHVYCAAEAVPLGEGDAPWQYLQYPSPSPHAHPLLSMALLEGGS